ncbi:hypothetical protein, partial [Mycobacterium intracellulare]
QACQLRIPESRALGPPDTIPLHPQTAGRNPDSMLIARSKSKSPQTAGRNPDFMLIARSKSKSPQTAGRNPDFMLIARSKSKSPHCTRIPNNALATST